MNSSHNAAIKLCEKTEADERFISLQRPEIDIVIWGANKKSVGEISRVSKEIFDKAAAKNLHLALLNYPVGLLPEHWRGVGRDEEYVTCLRSCLMKPEHEDWVDAIWSSVAGCLE